MTCSPTVKTVSAASTSTVVERFIEVLDLESAQIVVVALAGKGGQKTFAVGEPTEVVKTTVTDARGKGKSFTVLAQASTETDAATNVTTVSSFQQKGQNLSVVIKGTTPAAVPRQMLGTASLVSTDGNDANAAPIISATTDVKATLQLQEHASKLSNDAGDTLSAAVERIKAQLTQQGATEQP